MRKSRGNGKKGEVGCEDNSSKKEHVKSDAIKENNQKQKILLTTCLDCGLNWTDRHSCKAFGKICLKCGRIGHFARVCRFSVAKEGTKKDEQDGPTFSANKKNKRDEGKNNDGKENRSLNFLGAKTVKNNNNDNNNREDFKDKHVQKDQSEKKTPKKMSVKDDLAMKEEANTLYKQKKFKLALAQYTRLIELCPTNENHFNNRSACYMMMGQYENAFIDAKKALEVNPAYIKAHARLIKCALSLGNFIEAEAALKQLAEVDPSNSLIKSERAKIMEIQDYFQIEFEASIVKNYKRALAEINKSLSICTHSIPLKVRKGEYLALLCKYKDAETIANEILIVDKNNVEAKYILGLCIYQSDVDKALNYFRDILRLAPDHKKVVELYKKAKKLSEKKREGNDAFGKENYTKAYSLYEEAMMVDPNNLGMKMRLFYNKAQVSFKLGKIERSIEECSKALAIDSQYVKALMRRGSCYMKLKEWEKAVADLTRACRIDNGKDCQRLLDEAQRHLFDERKRQASAKKDYHKIIGVRKGASMNEIKKAYKEKAMLHHPDRHSNASDEEKKKHEKTFKEITQAYRFLTKEGGRKNHESDDDDSHEGTCTCRYCPTYYSKEDAFRAFCEEFFFH